MINSHHYPPPPRPRQGWIGAVGRNIRDRGQGKSKKVTSHTGQNFEAFPIEQATDIIKNLLDGTTVVAIDEAQFFDDEIIDVANKLADQGICVIVAGLDMDFRGEPFGPMPALLAKSERVAKLHAICMVCGDLASRTQRLVDGKPAYYNDPVVIVGADELYEARCREHHEVPRK